MRKQLVPIFRLASLLTLSVTVASPAVAAGPESGTVKGRLTVGGKATPLTHAYVRVGRDVFDRTKEVFLVVLSDVALPPEEFLEQFPGLRLAEKGKAHIVSVDLAADKSVSSSAVLHDAFVTEAFASTRSDFTPKTFDGKVVEGTLARSKPVGDEEVEARYEASFRAFAWRRPAATATGAAAAQTPQGRAAIAFIKAVTSGDKEATRKAVAPDTAFAKALDGPEAAEILKTLGEMNPKPSMAKVEQVTVLGNGAEVTVTGPKTADESTSHTLNVSLVGSEWRVSGETVVPWW